MGGLQAMGPFERIGPDSTSMDGPVTMARAERGEIPVRGTHPGQPYYMKPKQENSSELKDTDGLKLSLEANLDIEIELKASIRGDRPYLSSHDPGRHASTPCTSVVPEQSLENPHATSSLPCHLITLRRLTSSIHPPIHPSIHPSISFPNIPTTHRRLSLQRAELSREQDKRKHRLTNLQFFFLFPSYTAKRCEIKQKTIITKPRDR